MDNLKSLMRCLDDISNMIPEGTYLEMCDDLKRVHEIIPKDDDPPLLDTRRPTPVNVPFQVVQPGMAVHIIANESESESEGEGFGWYDEWIQNEEILQRLHTDYNITKKSLKKLKYIGNITKKVREDAIRDFCDGDIECVGGSGWTFDNLNRATIWSSDEEEKECTSKAYERTLYQNYKTRFNRGCERLRTDAMDMKRQLECEISEVRDRQNYLRVHYNL
uniref:Uncharacterized protein n=1 Tax=viral metagenome TaxID=1070528 RepID=A0A6C0J2T5_9ZZZZ